MTKTLSPEEINQLTHAMVNYELYNNFTTFEQKETRLAFHKENSMDEFYLYTTLIWDNVDIQISFKPREERYVISYISDNFTLTASDYYPIDAFLFDNSKPEEYMLWAGDLLDNSPLFVETFDDIVKLYQKYMVNEQNKTLFQEHVSSLLDNSDLENWHWEIVTNDKELIAKSDLNHFLKFHELSTELTQDKTKLLRLGVFNNSRYYVHYINRYRFEFKVQPDLLPLYPEFIFDDGYNSEKVTLNMLGKKLISKTYKTVEINGKTYDIGQLNLDIDQLL